jgi:hypothetical protein
MNDFNATAQTQIPSRPLTYMRLRMAMMVHQTSKDWQVIDPHHSRLLTRCVRSCFCDDLYARDTVWKGPSARTRQAVPYNWKSLVMLPHKTYW